MHNRVYGIGNVRIERDTYRGNTIENRGCLFGTVYRKTRHNAAPFEFFFAHIKTSVKYAVQKITSLFHRNVLLSIASQTKYR